MAEDKPEKTDPSKTEKILLIYIGKRMGDDRKLFDQWQVCNRVQFETGRPPDPDFRSYGKEASKRMAGSPGQVYEVDQTVGTTSIWPGSAKYLGLWPDRNDRSRWQAASEMSKGIEAEAREQRSDKSDNFAVLLPFHEAYVLAGHAARAALLTRIVRYVMSGR